MAEFKVSQELKSDIGNLRSAAQNLETALSLADSTLGYDDLQTLPTAKKFIDQTATIKELLRSYKALVVKDANDLSAMMDSVETMDNTIASSHGAG